MEPRSIDPKDIGGCAVNRLDRLVEWAHRVLEPEPMPWQGRLLIAAGSVAGAAWLVLLYVVFVGFADLAGAR